MAWKSMLYSPGQQKQYTQLYIVMFSTLYFILNGLAVLYMSRAIVFSRGCKLNHYL